MPNPAILYITADTRWLLSQIAAIWTAEKVAAGVRTQKMVKRRSDRQVTFEGLMGEFGVSLFLGSQMDLYPRLEGGSKTHDLTYHGRSIEVKTRVGYDGPKLDMIFNPEELQADVAVGAWFDGEYQVKLYGWLTREQFYEIAEERDYGYGKRLAVPMTMLNDIRTLKEVTR